MPRYLPVQAMVYPGNIVEFRCNKISFPLLERLLEVSKGLDSSGFCPYIVKIYKKYV